MNIKSRLSTWNVENILGISITHLGAAAALWYLIAVHFSVGTVVLAVLGWALACLAIAAGYHRYYAHKSYKITERGRWIEYFTIIFGSAAFQGPADWWASLHRVHHDFTDTARDPHSILRGFFFAHMGWLMRRSETVFIKKDLAKNSILRFQHRFHVPIGIGAGFVLPALLGLLWRDMLGGFLVGGFLRLVCAYHTTWSVNSFAHWWGSRPFDQNSTARDNWFNAYLSFGEAAGHNRHHKYPWLWWQTKHPLSFEPARWFISICVKLGFVTVRPTPAALA